MDKWYLAQVGDLLVALDPPVDRTGWTQDEESGVWWKIFTQDMQKPNVDCLVVRKQFVSERFQ